jgi:hypothetical protein
MTRSCEDRFWAKVNKTEACWEWTGYGVDGYGRFWLDGRDVMAHRVSYEWLIGPIPDGLQIDHLCRNRRCVNPAHMEPVTPRTNVLRGVSLQAQNALKTECPRGHTYDAVNTYVSPTGGRYCRTCQQAWSRTRNYRAERARRRSA